MIKKQKQIIQPNEIQNTTITYTQNITEHQHFKKHVNKKNE